MSAIPGSTARVFLRSLAALAVVFALSFAAAPKGQAAPRPPGAAEGTQIKGGYSDPFAAKLYDVRAVKPTVGLDPHRNAACVLIDPRTVAPAAVPPKAGAWQSFGRSFVTQTSWADLDVMRPYMDPADYAELAQIPGQRLIVYCALNVPTSAHSEQFINNRLHQMGIKGKPARILSAISDRQQCEQCSVYYDSETRTYYLAPYGLTPQEVKQQQEKIAAINKGHESEADKEKAKKKVTSAYGRKRKARKTAATKEIGKQLGVESESRKKTAGKASSQAFQASSGCGPGQQQVPGALGPPRSGGTGFTDAVGPAVVPGRVTSAVRPAGFAAVPDCSGEDEGDRGNGAGREKTPASGLGKALAGTADPGGIDFSSIRLRYLADPGDGSGLQYAFSAGRAGTAGDPRMATGISATQQSSDAFFVWLELDPSAFWVNLNPTEPDRIVDEQLGRTDAGRILLQADLQLKKSVGKLIHPDTALGKEFWGALEGNCASFRTWIVPAPAKVHEDGDKLYILDAPMDVKGESDYLKDKGEGQTPAASCPQQDKATDDHNEQLYRSLILPKLRKAVNTAPEYADLRRVYLSRVAAEWYRDLSTRQKTAYGSLVDGDDISGWTTKEHWKPTDTFDAYVKSYRNGEFKVTRHITKNGNPYVATYTYGGVDFSRVPFQKVSGGSFSSQYAGLPEDVDRSLTEPVADGSKDGTLWLGSPTPKQRASGDTGSGGLDNGGGSGLFGLPGFLSSARGLPVLVAALTVPLVAWTVLKRRRGRPAGVTGRGTATVREATWAGTRRDGAALSVTTAPRPAHSPVPAPPRTTPPPVPDAAPDPTDPYALHDPARAAAYLPRVAHHLDRPELDRSPADTAMLDAIGTAVAAGRAPDEAGRHFLRHHLTMADRMDDGAPPREALRAALRTHPFARHYSPDVIDRFPELFNNNWRRAWGMRPR